MSAGAPPHDRIASLDGLRGCAVLLVIAAHAAPNRIQSLGAAGVTVFFVLSGYLITSILLRQREGSGGGHLRGFYLRRARRLLPALLVLLVFESALRISSGQSLVPVVLAGAYVTNLAAATGHGSTLDHTWSLALEEQFYVLWPLAIALVRRRKHAATVVLVLAAASALARAVLFSAGHVDLAWFSPFTRADAILVGCALALAAARGSTLPGGTPGRVATGAALLTIAASFVWTTSQACLWLIPLVAVATAVLVSQLARAEAGPLATLLSIAPLRWTGRLSYAIYLWHPFALAIVISLGVQQRFLGTWALSTAIATVSWVLVERHFLRKAPRARRRADRAASDGLQPRGPVAPRVPERAVATVSPGG